MKILVYGDSNTWGDNFFENKRIDDDKQWVNILSKKFNNKHKFIQEGLPGRIAGDYEEKKFKNGLEQFMSTFRTCAPVDKIIISLGTNDLQIKYNKTYKEIFDVLMEYKNQLKIMFEDSVDKVKYFNDIFPEFIFIMPINFDYKNEASIILNEKSEEERLNLIKYFQKSNEKIIVLENATLFNDGIHLDYNGHEQMANIVYEALK